MEQSWQGGEIVNLDKLTVMLADNDPQFVRLVTYNLVLEGYKVHSASDGEQALELIESHVPDLVLLGLLNPMLDGFHVCRRIREFSAVPILLLIPRGKELEMVHALDHGADGYLAKPFSVDELLARMRALLRRAQLTARARLSACEDVATLRTRTIIGDLTVDYAQQRVTIGEREVILSQKESRLLAAMAQNARRVVPQDTLLEYVWGKAYIGDHHLLQVTINRLRRKLEPDPSQPRYILTKFGIGYILTGPV
jgi:DNA-binding response OmpR family regulator